MSERHRIIAFIRRQADELMASAEQASDEEFGKRTITRALALRSVSDAIERGEHEEEQRLN